MALVTTAGFEDAIEIGRQARPKLYDLFFDRIEPLVPAELRFGLNERTASDDRSWQAPSSAGVAIADREIIAQAHTGNCHLSSVLIRELSKTENAIAAVSQDAGPPSFGSHRILPEFREYERTSTVVVNAYLQPVMQHYLENLEGRARRSRQPGASRPIFVMQSSGGITSLASAVREPVRTVLSGPAGGYRCCGYGPPERVR